MKLPHKLKFRKHDDGPEEVLEAFATGVGAEDVGGGFGFVGGGGPGDGTDVSWLLITTLLIESLEDVLRDVLLGSLGD